MKRLDKTKWSETRDETETRRWYVSRPYRDRDVETETTSLRNNMGGYSHWLPHQPKYWVGCVPGIPGVVDASAPAEDLGEGGILSHVACPQCKGLFPLRLRVALRGER